MEKNTSPQQQVTITIGGISLGFRFHNRKLIAMLKSRYSGYCRPGRQCDCIFQCCFSKNKLAPYHQVRYSTDSGDINRARRYDFDVKWKDDGGEMTLWPSRYSFDACLRVVLANLIMKNNGLLLHASAVVRGGSAFVFIGPSGSGKTTIARLSGAKKILSDEIVALRTGPKKVVRVFATPFWGEMEKGPYCPNSYPAGSLFFLKKSSILSAQHISRHSAMHGLLRCVCLFGKEPGDLQTSLDTCTKIVSMVECRELHFPEKPLDWARLRERGRG